MEELITVDSFGGRLETFCCIGELGRQKIQLTLYGYTPSMALFHRGVDENGNTVNAFNDPLLWLKENFKLFLLVAALARLMLSIPATPAQSERLFSKTGKIVTDGRSSLRSDNEEIMLFSRTVWPVVESMSMGVREKPANKRSRKDWVAKQIARKRGKQGNSGAYRTFGLPCMIIFP